MSRRARWRRFARWCAAASLPTVHDMSEGGLLVAIAECCIEGGLGAHIDLAAWTRWTSSARAPAAW